MRKYKTIKPLCKTAVKTYNTEMLIRGIYQKQMKAYVHRNNCTRILKVALFIIAHQKWSKFPFEQE